ncbi:hypothetical protein ANO11243_054660 [Dothideomycetidae sp. 11243]|nr:hypothetical protein ANO11243_054660 [fungal sp. No.11243]
MPQRDCLDAGNNLQDLPLIAWWVCACCDATQSDADLAGALAANRRWVMLGQWSVLVQRQDRQSVREYGGSKGAVWGQWCALLPDGACCCSARLCFFLGLCMADIAPIAYLALGHPNSLDPGHATLFDKTPARSRVFCRARRNSRGGVGDRQDPPNNNAAQPPHMAPPPGRKYSSLSIGHRLRIVQDQDVRLRSTCVGGVGVRRYVKPVCESACLRVLRVR